MRFFSLRSLIVNSTFYAAYLTAANVQVYKEKKNFTCLRLACLFQAVGKHCHHLQSIVLSQCGSLSSQGITSLATKCRKLKMFDVAMTKVRIQQCVIYSYRVDRLFYINISFYKFCFQNKINP